jgi:hypothetical protein
MLKETKRDNLKGQKSLGPLKMSLEMAHKVIVPPKKNYIPQFLKQRDINSYFEAFVESQGDLIAIAKQPNVSEEQNIITKAWPTNYM